MIVPAKRAWMLQNDAERYYASMGLVTAYWKRIGKDYLVRIWNT